jgi:hypothetical protein
MKTSQKKPLDFRTWYDRFDALLVPFDCGTLCAPHNLNSKPFCCDICHAVPSVYIQELAYLEDNTDLWHLWRGDECIENPEDPSILKAETQEMMSLVACLGPDQCQRQFRSLSCRQFPFFPYISSNDQFLGLAYNWEFEDTCWIISHLNQVTEIYKQKFVQFYDDFFLNFPHTIRNYGIRSDQMRQHFISQKRSVPILHRDGGEYLLRPINERIRKVDPDRLPRFGFYQVID